MQRLRRFAGSVALLALVGCSRAPTGTRSNPERQAPSGLSFRSVFSRSTPDEDLGSLELVVKGLEYPSAIAASGGNAFVATRTGVVKIAPRGAIEKLDDHALRIATDGRTLVWLSARGITSAPLSDLGSRSHTETSAVDLIVNGGQVYAATAPPSGERGPSAILRVEIGKGGPPQTIAAAASYTDIAADATHVYFFAPPNDNAVEVRRVSLSGGESERVALVPTGRSDDIALSDTMVFFNVVPGLTSPGGGLYAVPKSGGAPRKVFKAGRPIASGDGIYFAVSEGSSTRIYHVDDEGEHLRLVAERAGSGLGLAVDDTGLYALAYDEGALFKLPKK